MPDVLDVPEPPSPAPPVLLDDEELAPLCSTQARQLCRIRLTRCGTQVVRNYGTVTVPKIYQNPSAGAEALAPAG